MGVGAPLAVRLVCGEFDYLLIFKTQGMAEYQDLMDGLYGQGIGIQKHSSHFVLMSPILKQGSTLPSWA